jgi:hypothetical protein
MVDGFIDEVGQILVIYRLRGTIPLFIQTLRKHGCQHKAIRKVMNEYLQSEEYNDEYSTTT